MAAPAAALALILGMGACSTPEKDTAVEETETVVEVQSGDAAEGDGEVTIYLTRHGKTMLNTTDRVQGWADSPLTEPGVEVAEDLGRGLGAEGMKFDAIYSSDSGRAIETAQLVMDGVGQTETTDLVQLKDLREWNFGTFEGDYNDVMLEAIAKQANYEGDEDVRTALTIEELADSIAAADETGVAENWDEIASRSQRALDTIVEESLANGDEVVLVTSHGLTINALLHLIDNNIGTVPIPNAAMAKVVYKDGVYTIETMNDESFIEKGAALR